MADRVSSRTGSTGRDRTEDLAAAQGVPMPAAVAADSEEGPAGLGEVGRWGAVPSLGSQVLVRPRRRDRWIDGVGLVVGPDQRYFPHPAAVFVAFPTGMTRLIDIVDLMIVTLPVSS